MRFRILGPLEVWDGGQPVTVGGPQQRALLAVLLLGANTVVPVDRLIECLWGGRPPATARGLLQGCVAQLRRTLRCGPAAQPVLTRAPGYLLQVPAGGLDLDRFEQLAAAAGAASGAGTRAGLAEADSLLSQALSLWRGPPLDGIALDACRAQLTGLAERRLTVLEQRFDVGLRLGQPAAVVGELWASARANPLRERLWAQLMLALAGADRRTDALAAYREVRELLAEQLGVEPGGLLRRLDAALRSGTDPMDAYRQERGWPAADPDPPPPAGTGGPDLPGGPAVRAVPAQLPAPPGGFTGRDRQLERLDRLLAGDASGDGSGDRSAVVVICGSAGIGKTALASRWAHRARDRFGDGQLYADLRGYAPAPPARPIEVLAEFLLALGVPADQVPVELEPAAALFRTVLADRRMLVLLDNAASAEQVRPLLPGADGCRVLVTSRDRLGGLVARDGARPLRLDVLDPPEAEALLARVLGRERVGAEPAATAQLARLCAYLPLALRIAAAHLTLHPGRGIADQVAELATGDRLGSLAIDGDEPTAVRAAFDLSYAALSPDAQRLFRLLGLVPGPDLTTGAAAALAGVTPAAAARLLRRLAGGHLLDQPATGRYACHDLLRLYAGERAAQADREPERAVAVHRLLDWYLDTADAAARLLFPQMLRLPRPDPPTGTGFADRAQALAWLDAERPNLIAAARHAAAAGPRPVAWLLSDALRGYFGQQMLPVDWLAMAHAGLAAAQAEGALAGQAAAQLSLADAHNRRSEYQLAIRHYTAAAALYRQIGWPAGQAAVLGNLGGVFLEQGRLAEAADHMAQALALHRQTGWRAGQAVALGNLGIVHSELGELERAAGHVTEALACYREIGSQGGEAIGLSYLGELNLLLGRPERALAQLSQALPRHREAGNRGGEVETLRALAAVHRDAGRLAEAERHARAAVALARRTGDPRAEAEALNVAGTVQLRLGHPIQAAGLHEWALGLARRTDARPPEAAALVGLAAADQRLSRWDRAGTRARQALLLAREAGLRLVEGQALTALAGIELASDRLDRAIAYAHRALASHRGTGHRLGEARTLLVLGHAEDRRGDRDAAAGRWREALVRFGELGAPEAAEVRALLSPDPGSDSYPAEW